MSIVILPFDLLQEINNQEQFDYLNFMIQEIKYNNLLSFQSVRDVSNILRKISNSAYEIIEQHYLTKVFPSFIRFVLFIENKLQTIS